MTAKAWRLFLPTNREDALFPECHAQHTFIPAFPKSANG